MEDVEWPLLTVEFNSLRGHQMDGIYEVYSPFARGIVYSHIYSLLISLYA
jgi:hypothetical protein